MTENGVLAPAEAAPGKKIRLCSGDRHWPLKLQLVPLGAAFLQNSQLLLAADCAGLAASNFPERYLPGKTALLVCPKLESKDAIVDKLAHILQQCDIQSLTLARMEVPCCCLPDLLRRAVEKSGDSRIAEIPVKTVVLTRFGQEKMPGLGMAPLAPPARKVRRDLSERPKAAPPAKREQARPPARQATP